MQATPATTIPEDETRLRELAHSLDCLTESDHLLLSGWSAETAKTKRKRGEGPPFIRHGLNYLYPKGQYAEYLQKRIHTTNSAPAKDLL